MSETKNYESDMYIDENALDVELLEQPALMMKYSKMLAELKRDRDLEKENLDLTRAELDKAIRADPAFFDIVKITETVITNTIITLKAYKAAMKEYLDTKFEVDVCQGVVSAIEQRKSALEYLVKLHGQQYFAGPSTPHDLTEARAKKTKSRNTRMKDKMKRKS